MRPTESMPSLSSIPMIQKEEWSSRPYFWENAGRPSGEGIVLQQTLSGSVAFWDKEGRNEAGEDQVILFRYGEESSYGLDERCRRPYRLIWALFTETPAVCSLVDDLRHSFGPVLRMSRKGEAATLLAHTWEARRHGVVNDRFTDSELTLRLLISLYREQMAERRGADPVSYGRTLLETQFRSPRNLKEWAEEIGLTREHFSREFRARYGETPADFLRTLRLRHAHLLLSTTRLTVVDIAIASGFASAKTFHRAFRDHFGIPPGEARTTRFSANGG